MGLKQKINYLSRSVINSRQEKKCPFCGHTRFKLIDRKYFFTTLIKCEHCGLSHRHSKDDQQWLKEFYQSEYDIDNQLMTHLPPDDELTSLMQENFPLLRDYSVYLNLLNADAKKILDYGCSWGYNVFKLNQSGYDAIGFEISVPRAEFGEKKLGVSIFSQAEWIRTDNDIVLSSHVIEHLADIAGFIKFSKSHLKRNGFFIAFCPNGSPEYRKREPDTFHINWGSLHPNYLDIDFASFMFRENPFYISTGDWEFDLEEIRNWNQTDQFTGSKRDGKELIIISKPNTTIRL